MVAWSVLRKYRIDATLVGVAGIVGVFTGTDAMLASHSTAHRAALGVVTAIGVAAVVWSGWRAVKHTAQDDLRSAQTQATVDYLLKPEYIREAELQMAKLVGEQQADALFRRRFDYSGSSTDTTARCHLCGFTTNDILATVRRNAVEHLREAHPEVMEIAATPPAP